MPEVYERPKSLDAALGILAGDDWTVLAGGTDVYPVATDAFAWGRPAPTRILDISAIDGLSGIQEQDDRFRIGSRVTWTELVERDLPRYFDGLKQAGREVGGVQIQNRGTLVGNICNASPAADGVPPLIAMDADVEIASATGTRTLPVSDFLQGNRRTALGESELVTAILVPKHGAAARSTFLKLGARRYLVISIAMVAAHQVSRVHTDMLIDRLGFDGDKVPRTYPTFGNTGPAAVPTVLSKEADAGRLKRGDRVILTGMGSGLNATAIEVVW